METKEERRERIKKLSSSNKELNEITRESIESAFLELLEKKNFNDITVTQVANKAGVSRAGLYRNYSTKEEIIESIFDSESEKIFEELNKKEITNSTQFWKCFLEIIYERKEKLKIIFQAEQGNIFVDLFLKNGIFKFSKEYDYVPTFQIKFYLGGLCFLIKEWVINDDIDIDEMVKFLVETFK